MLKVLDLFAGTQSVRKALEKMFNIVHWEIRGKGTYYGHKKWNGIGTPTTDAVVSYKGVDIYSPEGVNIILDLTQDDIVNKVKDELGDWTPDIIWASPICNKFSAATTGPKGNTYFVVENDEIRIRKNYEYAVVKHNGFNTKPDKWDDYVSDAEMAMVLHKNLVEVINYFNVPFAIENPANALSKYIYKDYVRNVAHYTAYGFEYKKPTAIYSNKELGLKKGLAFEGQRVLRFDRINKTDKWPSHWDRNVSTYANRSSVPPLLIKQIFSELLKGGNNE